MTSADQVGKALEQLTRDLYQLHGQVKSAADHVKGTDTAVSNVLHRANGSGNSSLAGSVTEYRKASQQVGNAHAAIQAAHDAVQKYSAEHFARTAGGAPGAGVGNPATTEGNGLPSEWSAATPQGDAHVDRSRVARRRELLEELGWSLGGAVLPLISLSGTTLIGPLAPVILGTLFSTAKLVRTLLAAKSRGLDDEERARVNRDAYKDFAAGLALDIVGAVVVLPVFGARGESLGDVLDWWALTQTAIELCNTFTTWRGEGL